MQLPYFGKAQNTKITNCDTTTHTETDHKTTQAELPDWMMCERQRDTERHVDRETNTWYHNSRYEWIRCLWNVSIKYFLCSSCHRCGCISWRWITCDYCIGNRLLCRLIFKQTHDTIISVIVYTRGYMWQNVEKLSWHVSLIEQNEICTLNMLWFWLLFISFNT